MKHDTPTPGDKRIYGHDVVARIEELEAELLVASAGELDIAEPDGEQFEEWLVAQAAGEASHDSLYQEEAEELISLRKLADECDGYDDWPNATLIEDGDFKEYAQDLADDIGAINRDARWPACHIDWDAAADALKMDYHCVDFGGYEYWVRA